MCKRNQTLSGSSYSMKWHKFLLFCLLLGGIANLLVGGLNLVSAIAVDQITAISLILTGALCVINGIFDFVVHGRLKNLCANGPKLLTALYIFQIVAIIITNVVPYILSPELFPLDSASLAGSVTGSIVWIAVNASYYKKRENVFVN